MADDEVQPPLPPRDASALRNRGRRREPTTIEGTTEEFRSEPGAPPNPCRPRKPTRFWRARLPFHPTHP